MTPSAYTEDTLVQQTTAEYLEQELGWESVYAYNTENFGPDSLLGPGIGSRCRLEPTPSGQAGGVESGLAGCRL